MNTDPTVLLDYLPLLIPLIAVQLGLILFALYKLSRKQQFNRLNKPAWVLIILFANMIGPIVYLVSEEYGI